MDDHSCISMCRDRFKDNLPKVCSICNENRPLLFIDDADRSDLNSLDLRNVLENITNDRLSECFIFYTHSYYVPTLDVICSNKWT